LPESSSVKVAVVQAAGVPFDRDAAVEKVCAMTAEAASDGARLVLFPEAYVGGYPWGLSFGTAVGGRSDAGRRTWERYRGAAVEVPGPQVERMAEAAREASVHLCVGVVERDSTYGAHNYHPLPGRAGARGGRVGVGRRRKPVPGHAQRLLGAESGPPPSRDHRGGATSSSTR
jgi:nitrilase